MEQRKRDQLILAIKRCIENTFDESRWHELAYLTGGKKIIYGHPRLLRSFGFGDEDYGSNILDVLESLLGDDSSNFSIIENYVKLPVWLKNEDPDFYEEIYGQSNTVLDSIEHINSSFELGRHISRIRNSVQSDPELAIGSTKELLESVMKSVLEKMGVPAEKKDIPDLLKSLQKKLNLEPRDVQDTAKGAKTVKRTLSNLGQLVVGINELRNLYGTGHGKIGQSGVSHRHARLVVGAGITLASFIMETYEARVSSKSH